MLLQQNPRNVYQRIEFDARVSTCSPAQLVGLCYEQLICALGTAIFAHDKSDNRVKSESLTRATSALIALQRGVSGDGSMADALNQIYTTARRAVLDSVLKFDSLTLSTIRQDFVEIAQALDSVRPMSCG